MNILYVSSLCSERKFRNLFETATIKPAQQAQKYHRLMVEGLAKNEGTSVKVISSLPVNRSISAQFYFRSQKEEVNEIDYRYLPFINLPILRHIFLFFTGFFRALMWCFKNKKGVVICDVLDITISSAALLASKIARTRSVGIVTDIPAFLAGMSENKISLKNKLFILINTFVMNRFNSYVFLTQFMNGLINKKHKPYVIIEGQVDVNMANTINEISGKYEKKVCIYAGAINRIYGIKLLTDAFIAAGVDNAELHIYGSGDFEEYIKKICEDHADIKYFGVVPNEIVVKEQLKATLLVNPRPTSEEYTKYSFPSKNMEYMVSGTPTLTTNLPGMPEEYQKYVYLIKDESVEGLTNVLKNVLSKTKGELFQKGMIARDYVLNNKNNIIQANKIIEMKKRNKLNKL